MMRGRFNVMSCDTHCYATERVRWQTQVKVAVLRFNTAIKCASHTILHDRA